MKNKFLEKLKNPQGWFLAVVLIMTLLCMVGSIGVLFLDYENTPFSVLVYALFAVSAVALGYTVYALIIVAPKIKGWIIDLLNGNNITAKILKNYGFRTVLFSAFSMGMSVLYSLYNGALALWFHSMWYGALAVYYITLVFLRSGIVLYHGKRRGKARNAYLEVRKYRNCGWLLVSTISALSAAILQMVKNGAGFVHAGLTIYVFAAYTFYKVTMSIINIFKANRWDDFTVKAVRCVNLADATVSILALQTALLLQFSDGSGMAVANAVTGMAVCGCVLALGILMIVRGNRYLKRLKNRGRTEENA
ncbi:MAG: hypothetical protein E7349_05985 [Clostridiales bacterium]|nr:hypothetical protein [Clostridiales bacterium]